MSRIRKVELSIDETTGNVSCTFVSCCVSHAEMLEAVTLFRDKLTEQIGDADKCPMSPLAYLPRLVHPPADVPPPRDLRCPSCGGDRFRFPAPSNVATCATCSTQVQRALRGETLDDLQPLVSKLRDEIARERATPGVKIIDGPSCTACGTPSSICNENDRNTGKRCCERCNHQQPVVSRDALDVLKRDSRT